ncbi:MAG: PAS domain-containing protein [Methanosarcinaceae archaeon]|nr:PAS domain-containing protein [Methanosarcinaceae archaeon]
MAFDNLSLRYKLIILMTVAGVFILSVFSSILIFLVGELKITQTFLITFLIIFFIASIFILLMSYAISNYIFSSINPVVSDIASVSKNVSEGNLSARANTSVNVDLKPIPAGLNEIIDSVTVQVNETKYFAENLEEGVLKTRVSNDLKGEFKEAGDALSNFSSVLQDIVYDSVQVLFSFQNDDFTREVKFYGKGDFQNLTEGIEHTRLKLLRITEEHNESEKSLIKHAQILQRSKDKAQYMEKIINNSPVVAFLIRIDRGWPLLYISENITQWGYSLKDFKTGVVTYFDFIYRKDRLHLFDRITEYFYSGKHYLVEEYRIMTKTGEIRWVESRMQFIRGEGKFVDLQGINIDITERKIAEEKLAKTDELRKKEIHHRIKNNLQVISTMLYLESSKFTDEEILKAFTDSQNRVKSMALIHEELYKSESSDLQHVNFKSYIEKLVDNLFKSYKTGNNTINMKVKAIQINLGIDIATPLGTIINELITNSLKYAFLEGCDGNIWIVMNRIYENGKEIIDMEVGDDGISNPEDFEKEDGQSLGLQLVFALVEQINGTITMDFKSGTKYHIYFPIESESEHEHDNDYDGPELTYESGYLS